MEKLISSRMDANRILQLAMTCEQTGHVMEAQCLYEEGIQMLHKKLSNVDGNNKMAINKRMVEFMTRSKQLTAQMQHHLSTCQIVDKIKVADGSRGYSYSTLFGRYMTSSVKEVHIYEPYLSTNFHFKNLVSFIELLIKRCRNLQYIRLITRMATHHPKNQLSVLERIRTDAADGGITFRYRFMNHLRHDRKIVLSNGFVFKIGRGLHFFQPSDSWLSLGMCDYDFRRCLRTEIDVYQSKPFTEKIQQE